MTRTNRKINTVFLGCSYHNLSSYYRDYEHKKVSNINLAAYFFILPFDLQFYDIWINRKTSGRYLKTLITSGIKNIYSGNIHSLSYIGKFEPIGSDKLISKPFISKRILYQYFNASGNIYDFDTDNISYLNKIKAYCAKKKIRLHLVNTPLHKEYVRLIPRKFISKYNELVKNSNTINCNERIFEDNDFLPDGDHISSKGAVKFSNCLSSHLSTRL